MKKTILSALMIVFAAGITIAQTATAKKQSGFETAMLTSIQALDTASSAATLITLANTFERIGNAEKTKWQPFYYAAYGYVAMAYNTTDKTIIDELADKAEAYLLKAEEIEKNNSEISCMFAMINSCRIMVDPVSRFQTKGKEVQILLAKAKAENVNNPRIYLLQARMQLRTPEAFGGGKEIAKKTAETAVEKFKAFQPENNIAPNWGENQAKTLLDKINAQ